ncbi:MAG: DUF2993 domain-containing protein [Nodosilinea sp.]
MDIFTLIIATLTGMLSPVGAVVDNLAEDALRAQVAGAEELYVRIDNVPNYQILNGRIEHGLIAGRGVYLRQLPDLRINSIDLETDAVDVDLNRLQQGELKLDEPAQAALRIRLRADDLNAFLSSSSFQAWLDTLRFTLPGPGGDRERDRYGLANPSLEFLAGDRIRVMVDLEDRVAQEDIAIVIELGVEIINGHRFKLIDPKVAIDGEEAPPELITSLVEGASHQLTLRQLEAAGVTARILTFKVRDNELDLAIFARIEPSSPFLVPQPAAAAVPPTP